MRIITEINFVTGERKFKHHPNKEAAEIWVEGFVDALMSPASALRPTGGWLGDWKDLTLFLGSRDRFMTIKTRMER